MANETLHIENFAGIDSGDIELSRMNLFIGPQASGKSVSAKLLYFFKECFHKLVLDVINEQAVVQIRASQRDTFLKYFPAANWGKGLFTIRYSTGEVWIEIRRKTGESSTVNITYSPQYRRLLENLRNKVKISARHRHTLTYEEITKDVSKPIEPDWNTTLFFVPAGRSFFSTLRNNVFQFLANDAAIDPFLINFGSFYEAAQHFYRRRQQKREERVPVTSMVRILQGTYRREKTQDYLAMQDNRLVALENCSSGQQEALPLILALDEIAGRPFFKDTITFIEEPETHLYPAGQREIMHLIATSTEMASETSESQCIITTHSPYILTALNNLMYAGKIARDEPAKRSRVTAVIGDETLLDPRNVRAYYFGEGRIKSILDPETELADAALLDSVSGELSQEFEHLVDIEFEKEAA